MTKLNVPKMSCGHCKAAIEKAVADVDADARVSVDLENRTVSIESSIASFAQSAGRAGCQSLLSVSFS
jgi:copper chaperone